MEKGYPPPSPTLQSDGIFFVENAHLLRAIAAHTCTQQPAFQRVFCINWYKKLSEKEGKLEITELFCTTTCKPSNVGVCLHNRMGPFQFQREHVSDHSLIVYCTLATY